MKFLRSGLILLSATLLSGFFYTQTAFTSSLNQGSIIQLTNQARIESGLGTLSVSPKLNQAAQNKAEDIYFRNYWSHETPEGKPFWYFVDQVGYNWSLVGENLATNFRTAERASNAWLLSHPHRKNILNKKYEDIGVGISKDVIVVLYGKENKSIIDQFQEFSYLLSKFLIFHF